MGQGICHTCRRLRCAWHLAAPARAASPAPGLRPAKPRAWQALARPGEPHGQMVAGLRGACVSRREPVRLRAAVQGRSGLGGDQTDGKRALFPRLQIRNPFQNAQVMHMRGGKIGRKRANSMRAPPRTRFQAGRSRLLRAALPLCRGLRSVSRTPPTRQNVLASARPSPPAAHGLCPPARSSLPFPS